MHLNTTNAGQTSKPSNQFNLLLLSTIFQQLSPTYPLSSRTSTEDPDPPYTNLKSQKNLIKTKRTDPSGLSRHLKFLCNSSSWSVKTPKPPNTQNLKTPPPSRSDVSRFTQPNGNPARLQNANMPPRSLAFPMMRGATRCMQPERGKLEQVGVVGKQATGTELQVGVGTKLVISKQ